MANSALIYVEEPWEAIPNLFMNVHSTSVCVCTVWAYTEPLCSPGKAIYTHKSRVSHGVQYSSEQKWCPEEFYTKWRKYMPNVIFAISP